MGIIMVFSVSDQTSFQSLQNWLNQIKANASQDVVKMIVGNKADVNDRKVSFEEAKKLAQKFGIEYF